MVDDEFTGRRPLVIGIGGVGCSLASDIDPSGFDVVCIDTDIRTRQRIKNTLIIGEDMVQGEGCGGNMTLGKAVFRRSLDLLRVIISEHSPVFTISSMGGGTGIPGVVELNQVLRTSVIPCFNIVVVEEIGNDAGLHARALANIFLAGPLCPGSLIPLRSGEEEGLKGSTLSTGSELNRAVSLIASASSQAANVVVPGAVWHIFAREMRPFSISILDLLSIDSLPESGPSSGSGEGQTLMIVEMPVNLSNTDTEKIMESLGAGSRDTHLGLTENPGRGGGITVVSIGLSGDDAGTVSDRNLTHITREYVEELMSEGYGMTLDRNDPLM
jgi:hypothetical protein